MSFGEDDGNGVTGEYLAPGVRHVPVAIRPPLDSTAMATSPASVNAVPSGRPPGVNLASPLVVRPSAAISHPAVTSGSGSTTDGLMAWDLAVADLSWTGLGRTQRKRT